MRLLHTTKLHLVESHSQGILPSAIPPYAILYHTWAKEEGYEKVAGACALAVQDGIEYLWIDTCCIDKSSSAELSEAINSMFRWYRDADKGFGQRKSIGGLERDRRENKGEEPCCCATQRVDGEGSVVVEVQSRRRSNGWSRMGGG
ncbi:hypothetical protein MYCTH_2114023 [Thermothelomyces thermophilus ATCC 42464]|uniref:Heterokaryon incompatibility domain-containing protein n=1 Tax=Thermothelomyces thermophilus (strain ATCC 42464 / BCRC 31852 / DSM 1799) TaxID=573729 RepID=G2QP44_THET4|nr:uncharacterized protein MYCTH_2114023 [Thermothelomyces thermophilus ATCC 42464]AEO62166.1 hypothetical protein MYCTH_2114023 [Thermothelomyces thermophilus ATCC 42464]